MRRSLVLALTLSAVFGHANGTAAVQISGMGPSGTNVVNPGAKKE